MNSARAIGARLFTAVFLAAGLLVATPIHAEVVAPDQVIGPQPEGTGSSMESMIVIPNDEPATRGLEPGFERPLNVPDRMTDGEGTRLPLGTPDQLDADIRESDERASTSF
jgi:hypothetical protein